MLAQSTRCIKKIISGNTKFPQFSLLVFLFLITEIGTVTSSSVPATGVTNVRKASGKHHGVSLKDANFYAGNLSRHEDDHCIADGCICILPPIFGECCGECLPIPLLGLVCEGGSCTPENKNCDSSTKCCDTTEDVYTCTKNGKCEYACRREGYSCSRRTSCCNMGKEQYGYCDWDTEECATCIVSEGNCSKDNDCCYGENGNDYGCIGGKCQQKCFIEPTDSEKCTNNEDCCNDDSWNAYYCKEGKCSIDCSIEPEDEVQGTCEDDEDCCPDKNGRPYECFLGTCAKVCSVKPNEGTCIENSDCCNDDKGNEYYCNSENSKCEIMCTIPSTDHSKNCFENGQCCNDDDGNEYICDNSVSPRHCMNACTKGPEDACVNDSECCNDAQNKYICKDGSCKAKVGKENQKLQKNRLGFKASTWRNPMARNGTMFGI